MDNPNISQQLIELLNQGDEAQRCYSARAVAQAKLTQAAPNLNSCLYHPDPDVVIDAADALEKLAGKNISTDNSNTDDNAQIDIDALTDVAQNHQDGDARLAAINALATIRSSQVDLLLAEFAQGRREDDDWGLTGGWDDWLDLQLRAVQHLGERQFDSNITLFSQLIEQDPEPELEQAVYIALAKQKAAGSELLFVTLDQSELMRRRKIARALAFSLHPQAPMHLFKLLRDDDAEIRRIAIQGIAALNATQYQWDLVQHLSDTDSMVQRAAGEALAAFSGFEKISAQQIIRRLQTAEDQAKIYLLEFLSQQAISLTPEHYDQIREYLIHSNPEVVITTAVLLAQNQDPLAIEPCLIQVQKTSIAEHLRCRLIRLLPDFNDQEQTAEILITLNQLINKEEQSVAIRQAAIEALAQIAQFYSVAERTLKHMLLGSNSEDSAIPVTQIEEQNELLTDESLSEKQEPEEQNSEEELQTLEGILASLDAHYPESLEQKPTSTLRAIQQTNVQAMLEHEPEKPEQTILEMVDEAPSELDDYSDIVRSHFDAADKLELNRKKIAKLPQASNQQLATRALATRTDEKALALLFETLLGADPTQQYETLSALALIAPKTPHKRMLRNSIGAAGLAIHQGAEEVCIAASRLLAHLPPAEAVPLLIVAVNDKSSNVRVSGLLAIETLLEKGSKVSPSLKTNLIFNLRKKLKDQEGGTRKHALILLGQLKAEEALQEMLNLAVDDQECSAVAASALKFNQEQALTELAQKLPQLSRHQQPLAIQLAGQLLA